MTQIGPFQILDELGRGGMAVVYRALRPSVNRIEAVKVLPPELEADPHAVQQFRQEAEIAANLNHPNIVKVWSASTDAPPYYIAMEYLDGGSLADRLDHGPLPLHEAVAHAIQLSSALDHASKRHIVHRDIKPTNILFDENHRPVLTDFGIAQSTQTHQTAGTEKQMGTPDYMSPEQALGQALDIRSDLFSLAIVLYEMLTGVTPFAHAEPHQTLQRILHDDPVPPSQVNPHLPEVVDVVLRKALRKSPNARFQHGSDLIEVLERIAGPQYAHGGVARARPFRNALLIVSLSVVLLGAGAIMAYILRPQRVPNVIGLPEARARVLMTRHGLQPTFTTQPDAHPRGQVIGISLPPGTPLPKDRQVAVTCSGGLVPNFVGERFESGNSIKEAELKTQGIAIRIESQPDEKTERGIVLGQQPPANSLLPDNNTVQLIVSAGKPEPVVSTPDPQRRPQRQRSSRGGNDNESQQVSSPPVY